MTIKEVEARTGMTRANIRFYETEGFISPLREKNGYRDYSEYEVEVLLRVKLLRLLGMPLEDIKELHFSNRNLLDALDEHIQRLELEQGRMELAQQVCHEMRGDVVHYETMDPRPYLDELAQGRAVPEEDAVPRVKAPWRRYFARMLDWAIYVFIWEVIVAVFGVQYPEWLEDDSVVSTLMGIVLTVVLEPVLLHFFATTPGKAVWGLSVTDLEDGRLTYQAGLARTIMVLGAAQGLHIPVLREILLIVNYFRCEKGRTLGWEEDSTLHLKDTHTWRTVAFVAAYLAAVAAAVLVSLGPGFLPRHSGDLTVAQFCENYNAFSYARELSNGYHLTEDGEWEENYAFMVGKPTLPEFVFTEENGEMTGLSFAYEKENTGLLTDQGQAELFLCVLSYACAQEPFGAITGEGRLLLERINEDPYESFTATVGDVTIDYQVSYYGFEKRGGNGYCVLFPVEGEENYFSVTLQMSKIS